MAKQRIDKIFSNLGILSRSECSKAAKSGSIAVNGIVCKASSEKADPDIDVISYCGKTLDTRTLVYYMLNKPAGCITANEDKHAQTVFDYIEDTRTDLSAVGRLDRDTTGILLITNDGDLNHRLLSPRYHVPKTYNALVDGRLSEEDIALLAIGSMVKTAEDVREQLKQRGYSCSLVNARFAKPIDEDTVDELCKRHKLIVTMEENVKSGGFGERVLDYITFRGLGTRVLNIALPDDYIEHGNVELLKRETGIDADSVVKRVIAEYAGMPHATR